MADEVYEDKFHMKLIYEISMLQFSYGFITDQSNFIQKELFFEINFNKVQNSEET